MFRRFISSSISSHSNQYLRQAIAARSYAIISGGGRENTSSPQFGGSQPGSTAARTVTGNLSEPRPSSLNPVGVDSRKAQFASDYFYRGKDVATGTVSKEEIDARKEHEITPDSVRNAIKGYKPDPREVPDLGDDDQMASMWVGPEIRSRKYEPDDEEPQVWLKNVPNYKKEPLGTPVELSKENSRRSKPSRRHAKRAQ